MEDLSVVIVTRNRLDKLKRCVASVQEKLPKAQVIVIDNGSTDGTVVFLKGCHNVKTNFLVSNVGPAAARNVAIRESLRSYIMFLDDDAWISKLNIGEIKQFFIDNLTVGIIAPRLLYPNLDIQESVRSFPTVPFLLWRGTFLRKVFPRAKWYEKSLLLDVINSASKPCVVEWAISACFIVRKSIFDLTGSFDDKYFIYYEDADMCYRAKLNGYSVYYWPDATIYHEYARSSANKIGLPLMRHILSICRFFWKR